MIWSLIGSIGGKVLDIVDDVVEDKDEANRLKFEIQRQLIENGKRSAFGVMPFWPKRTTMRCRTESYLRKWKLIGSSSGKSRRTPLTL